MCLKLIYEDLAMRTSDKIMDSKTLEIFFHMNSMWGASLLKRFVQVNSKQKQISLENFIQAVLKFFKEGT